MPWYSYSFFKKSEEPASLPIEGLFNAFVPGYSHISRSVLEALGFDASLVVYVLAFASAMVIAVKCYRYICILVSGYMMASIVIDSRDDAHEWMISWLSEQPVGKRSLSLDIKSGGYGEYNPSMIFKAETVEAPPRFQPQDSGWFWHKGSCFQFVRHKNIISTGSGMASEKDRLTIKRLGRSTVPIKELIHEARGCQLALRPSRPIETVVLDASVKSEFLDDIKEYLRPDAHEWYASRGVPYRRGYLLHGPSGTGKTSLCFAAAGVFDLEIHCISLRDSTLSEEDLSLLFSKLPSRCIVLLEDIDATVTGKNRKAAEKREKENSTAEIDENQNGDISLSALLDSIDGVASNKGRILFMTTNYPERLDGALTRPGRIDMRISFSLATKTQIKGIFLRIYSPDKNHSNEEERNRLASLFADDFPELAFSPAEVQGFLLTRKNDPQRAVNEVREWRQEILKLRSPCKALI